MTAAFPSAPGILDGRTRRSRSLSKKVIVQGLKGRRLIGFDGNCVLKLVSFVKECWSRLKFSSTFPSTSIANGLESHLVVSLREEHQQEPHSR
jgi:hypothetical protein